MPTSTQPTDAVDRLRAAMQSGDADAAAATVAPDVVIHSPITVGFQFRGREQARALFADVIATIDGLEYTEQIGDGDRRVLLAGGRVGAQEVREALVLRLDEDGRIAEITLFVRPLPGLTAIAARLGPRVAARRGRARGLAVAALIRPLAFATRAGEGLGVRLARP
jgi:hypothetical protein